MIAQQQGELVYPLRWWAFGPIWRYERPAKGRSREFFQWNIDIIGADSPEADAELQHFRALAGGAGPVLGSFAYYREMTDETSWTLEFSAKVGEFSLKGIDIIRFGDDGRIVDFDVLVRPFKGLQALAEAMQKQLAAQGVAA